LSETRNRRSKKDRRKIPEVHLQSAGTTADFFFFYEFKDSVRRNGKSGRATIAPLCRDRLG
jgi:hypothetical protein